MFEHFGIKDIFCGLPGAFQVYCGWCGTWRREGMMEKFTGIRASFTSEEKK